MKVSSLESVTELIYTRSHLRSSLNQLSSLGPNVSASLSVTYDVAGEGEKVTRRAVQGRVTDELAAEAVDMLKISLSRRLATTESALAECGVELDD